jgi:predicted DNA-binding transcriptional regulator AlpA
MDRTELMESLENRAFDKRVRLSDLCVKAGLSRTIAYRFTNQKTPPTLPVIGKLERALADIESQSA